MEVTLGLCKGSSFLSFVKGLARCETLTELLGEFPGARRASLLYSSGLYNECTHTGGLKVAGLRI